MDELMREVDATKDAFKASDVHCLNHDSWVDSCPFCKIVELAYLKTKAERELSEMRQVLDWANDNVAAFSSVQGKSDTKWHALPWHPTQPLITTGTTLYQALHSAWVSRDTTKDL